MSELNFLIQETFATPLYMHLQDDISPKMRVILVDWLIDTHFKEKMHESTLWLCVNLLDRYLGRVTNLRRGQLQLAGVACMLMAAKFEEIYPPEVDDFVSWTDHTYNRSEIIHMESDILAKLDYQLVIPTAYHFIVKYLQSIEADGVTTKLTYYYAERFLQEYDSLSYKPHELAAACIFAAIHVGLFNSSKRPAATDTLAQESGLPKQILRLIASKVVRHLTIVHRTSKRALMAAKRKYSDVVNESVAQLPLPQL